MFSDYIDLDEVVDDLADLALVLREKDHVEEVGLKHYGQLVCNILGAAFLHLSFFDGLTDESGKEKVELCCSAGNRLLKVFELVNHLYEVADLLLIGIGLVEDVFGDA